MGQYSFGLSLPGPDQVTRRSRAARWRHGRMVWGSSPQGACGQDHLFRHVADVGREPCADEVGGEVV